MGQGSAGRATKLHQHPERMSRRRDGPPSTMLLTRSGRSSAGWRMRMVPRGDADKMGVGDAQVIQQAQDILGHGPKAVVPFTTCCSWLDWP